MLNPELKFMTRFLIYRGKVGAYVQIPTQGWTSGFALKLKQRYVSFYNTNSWRIFHFTLSMKEDKLGKTYSHFWCHAACQGPPEKNR